ncbi:FAD-dependent oxidoreductase [Lactobacillus sp. ESL0731]|uniref:FAD-dependent oxidoreductase n=1 Tax=unclassified Lactobacillus TaxID=2620435 RepID=UPI0023F8DBB2|nr:MULTISPECIES: FAD-dependent oxidoreductase [unclassified Lactobacillus]WEV51095.1 FAD-dependent oxidoreductase [Lactobacillus sp. ESL0700]WEV62224.1 FAD-dependent oxidoreductase [Lactobacillus sp. ESL0731]
MNNKFDVIVVGGSNAGGFAAAAAAEKGQHVLVIDKSSTTEHLYRHWLGGVNTKAQKKAGVEINKKDLAQYLTAFTQDNVDQKLIWTWINKSGETLDWLEEKILRPRGEHLYNEPDAYWETMINRAFPTEHHVSIDDKSDDKNYGLYVIEYAKNKGAEYRYNTKLEHLITDDSGRVIGAKVLDVTTNEHYKIYSKAVILCTGGYGANKELLKKWNPTVLDKCCYTQSPRDDGSGIIAALEIGAAKDQEAASIIFDRGLVPVGTKSKDTYIIDWRNHQYNLGSFPFLKVNLKGERFFNESAPYQFDMNALMHQPGHMEILIWNQELMENLKELHTLGCSRVGWPGNKAVPERIAQNDERIKKGLVKKANSIEELASKLDLPKDTLMKTVNRYNKLADEGNDIDFGKEKFRLVSIEKPPYYGAWFSGVLLSTLDGLHINDRMQVLDHDCNPIFGLYAAGNCSGGFFWGSYEDRVPGLTCSHAQTFGRLAGQYAASGN